MVQEVQETTTLIGLAATGFGIAVVPSGLTSIRVPNIVYRRLSDADASTEIQSGLSRRRRPSAIISAFQHMAQAISREGPPFRIGRKNQKVINSAGCQLAALMISVRPPPPTTPIQPPPIGIWAQSPFISTRYLLASNPPSHQSPKQMHPIQSPPLLMASQPSE